MTVLVSILVTALALALDAFAVSVAAGLSRDRPRLEDALRLATCFGGMQAAMPAIGVVVGAALRPFVEGLAPMLGGVVLVGLGAYGARNAFAEEDERPEVDFFATPVLLSLGLATSIDAFAAGVSLAFSRTAIVAHLVGIGVVTFVLCFAGVRLAGRLSRLLGPRAQLAGALALAALGLAQIGAHLPAWG